MRVDVGSYETSKFNSILIRARWVNWLRPGEDLTRFGSSVETVAFGMVLHLLLVI